LKLAFVSSAFNEEENLEELYRRCRAVHAQLAREFADRCDLRFCMLVADNGSEDGSLAVLEKLIQQDPAVVVLANRMNYGAEASAGNLIDQARAYDLVVCLCSDLQDPPEIATTMVRTLLERPDLDAVLAVKQRSQGGPLLRLARRTYYKALGLSSRRPMVPSGFHGFGCYRQAVLEEATRFWNSTDLNVRQCLDQACQPPSQSIASELRRPARCAWRSSASLSTTWWRRRRDWAETGKAGCSPIKEWENFDSPSP
jgi:glycosyltransferase involved in cell wall biosynthesis